MTTTTLRPMQHTALSAAATFSTIVDRLEVVDALYRFGAGQDLRDRPLFESAFTADAVLDFSEPAGRFGVTLAPFEGRRAIADAVFGTIAPLRTSHTVTNPRVTLDGDRASLFALVEAQHVRRDEPARFLLLKNSYVVDLERAGDAWAIVSMRIENIWYSGEPSVLFAAPTR